MDGKHRMFWRNKQASARGLFVSEHNSLVYDLGDSVNSGPYEGREGQSAAHAARSMFMIWTISSRVPS
jgi:hypothetical protein